MHFDHYGISELLIGWPILVAESFEGYVDKNKVNKQKPNLFRLWLHLINFFQDLRNCFKYYLHYDYDYNYDFYLLLKSVKNVKIFI